MTIGVITLSAQGAVLADRLAQHLEDVRVYVHDSVDSSAPAERFTSILELTAAVFPFYRSLVYIAPCGVVVRAIAPHIRDKRQDPAVVVVDAGGRWAVSLLSGHEGGANQLALQIGNTLFAEPVISTTTEALKTVIVGIGCRRGTGCESIVSSILQALEEAGAEPAQVRLLSSVDLKADEPGLLAAAEQLGIPLRLISREEIRNSARDFQHSDFVQERIHVPAVAEPAALLAGRRTRLLLRRKSYNGVTVALAQEDCLWSE
jgi:cobalt-precorrin 5A hydrolase